MKLPNEAAQASARQNGEQETAASKKQQPMPFAFEANGIGFFNFRFSSVRWRPLQGAPSLRVMTQT